MTILIGDMEPHLAIDIANALDEDNILMTQYISSYIYYKVNTKNKKTNIIYIKDFKRDEITNEDEMLVESVNLSYEKSHSLNNISRNCKPYIAGVIKQVKYLINNNNIKSVVLWNIVSAANAAVYALVDKNKTKINILENGFFRPDTVTLDHAGLNVNSDYYNKSSKIKKINKHTIYNDIKPLVTKKGYLKYRFLEFLPFWPLNNAYYSLSKQYKKQKLKKTHIGNIDLSNIKYAFLALQLMEDSQNVYYSKYEKYNEIICDALNLIEGSDLKLVVKPHPLDINIQKCLKEISELKNNNVIISGNNTEDLISLSNFVICVNSTVGFEALLMNKEVHLLGNSIYEGLIGVNGNIEGDDTVIFRKKTQVDFNVNDYNSIDNLIGYLN